MSIRRELFEAPPIILIFELALYFALAFFSEYWLGVITDHPIGSDFSIYYDAYLDASTGGNPYAPYNIGTSFINHPFVLSLVSLFSGYRDKQLATHLWVAASVLAWIFVIWLVFRLVQPEATVRMDAARFGWLLVVSLGFAPFLETVHIGQINVFALASLCLMFYSFERGNPMLSGLFLATSIVLKTSPVIFILYFVALRQFRLLASCAVSLIALSLVPVVQFSSSVFTDFLHVVPQLGGEIRPSRYNQSILGLLFLILYNFGMENPRDILMVGHRIALAAVLGLILLPPLLRSSTRESRLWTFALLLLAMTLFSPLVWYHHAIFMIFPLAMLLLHTDRRYSLVGIGSILLIQVERGFEFWVTPYSWPVISAGFALLGVGLWIYLNKYKTFSNS